MQAYEHSSSSGQTEFEKNKLLTVMRCCSTNLYPACSWAWKRVTCANKALTGDGKGTCKQYRPQGEEELTGQKPSFNTVLLALVYKWKARNDYQKNRGNPTSAFCFPKSMGALLKPKASGKLSSPGYPDTHKVSPYHANPRGG